MAAASIPENAQDASLERLGINVQTVAPSNIMTSKEVEKVKFRKSRPIGYLMENVDSYQGIVGETLTWYEQAILSRDGDVLRLGSELDRVEVELLRARQEIAVAAANAPFQEAINQAKEDPEVEAIMRKAQEAERKVERTEKRLKAAEELAGSRKDRIAELETELAAALTGTAAADSNTLTATDPETNAAHEAEITSLRAQLADTEATVAALEGNLDELNRYAEEQDAYIDTLIAMQETTPEVEAQVDAVSDYTAEDQGGFDLENYDGLGDGEDETLELAGTEEPAYEAAPPLGAPESAHTPRAVAAELAHVGGLTNSAELDDEAALQLVEEPASVASNIEYDADGDPIYYWEGIRLPKGLTPEAMVPQDLPGAETLPETEGR